MTESHSKQRVGILGGSFNPIHIGHLLLAQSALDQFELGRVFFMPCHIQPHKARDMLADDRHRLAMVELGIGDNLQFEPLDIELRRGGTSYAIDSVAELQALCPDSELFFIIGADTLRELHGWHRIGELLQRCTFVTLARPGFALEALTPDDLGFDAPTARHLLSHVALGRRVDVSSSDIRHRVAEGMSIRYLVPDEVEMYICEHGLYRG